MSTKRIRCECGRVYEPAKYTSCPSCGVTAVVEQQPAPISDKDEGQTGARLTSRHTADDELVRSAPFALTPRTLVIGGGVVVALAVLIVFLTRPRQQAHVTTTQAPASSSPAAPNATAAASVNPTAAPTYIPPQQPNGIPQPFDLAAAIASAAPGAMIKVPPGFYQGGLVLTKPVRLISSGGQSWIQSDGRECLNVKSPGVFVQGMQFMCNGIGDLAAISIADGGELELDGCRIQSATSVGLTSSNASLTTTGTTITASGGTALRVKGGKANLTQTTLSDSKLGASLSAGAAVELKSCALERDGAGDAQTGVIFINGPATSVTATDCQFTGNNGGVYVTSGGSFTAEKTSFKENAAGAKYIYGLILVEKASVVRLNGCAFERNRAGVAVSEGGTLEADQCAFSDNGLQSRQLIAESLPISVIGQHARATVRNSSFAHSTPYAIGVSNAGTATIDNIEVSGTKDTGLAVGDDKTPPAHVEVAHAHFHNNENGMAVFFGSTAKIDDSEFRENETSGLAAIKNAQVEVHNTRFLMNGNEGLLVYGQARAVASGCQFIGNARGAESGYAKRNAGGHASLTIEDSEVGGNRVFGLGALSANELIVRNVTFHGDDKVPIYREKNAVVKMETPAGAQTEPDAHESPSPGASASATPNELPEATASPQPSTSPGKSSAPKKSGQRTRQRQRRPDDEAARILRNIFGPH